METVLPCLYPRKKQTASNRLPADFSKQMPTLLSRVPHCREILFITNHSIFPLLSYFPQETTAKPNVSPRHFLKVNKVTHFSFHFQILMGGFSRILRIFKHPIPIENRGELDDRLPFVSLIYFPLWSLLTTNFSHLEHTD